MKEIKRDVARHLFFVVQWRYRIFIQLRKNTPEYDEQKRRTSLTDAQRRSKARSAYQKAKRKKQLHNRIFIIILIAVVVLIAIGAIVRIRHNHAKTTSGSGRGITSGQRLLKTWTRIGESEWNCGSLYGKPGNDGATEQELFRGIGGVSYYPCKQSFCDWAGGRNRTVYSVR